jgi:hypothetical protein
VGDERRPVRQYRQLRYPAVHGRVGRERAQRVRVHGRTDLDDDVLLHDADP